MKEYLAPSISLAVWLALPFAYDSYYGHYYNIFSAVDGSVGEISTNRHAYVYLRGSSAGHCSSSIAQCQFSDNRQSLREES